MATHRVEILSLDPAACTTTLRIHSYEAVFPDATAAGLFLLSESAVRAPSSPKDKVFVKLGAVIDARLVEVMQRWEGDDYTLFFAEAARFVVSFDPLDTDAPEACMDFKLVTTETSFLSHLRKGSRWDSNCPQI